MRSRGACILILLLMSAGIATAQQDYLKVTGGTGFQYGFSAKCRIDFDLKKKWLFYRIGLNGGLGLALPGSFLYPSYNLELQIYNNGLGSLARSPVRKRQLTVDMVNAVTLTGGIKNWHTAAREAAIPDRNIPLYYFSDFARPALQNPYQYSISLGTNFILSTDKGRPVQRLGFFNFHAGRFQVSYLNDGAFPFSNLGLADGEDRFYTGGVLISYHIKPNKLVDQVFLSYHKFTGYTKNAFELSNELDLATVNYADRNQHYYNKGSWTLGMGNLARSWTLRTVFWDNTHLDLQHIIHYRRFDSYHLSPYPQRISLSGEYGYQRTFIHVK